MEGLRASLQEYYREARARGAGLTELGRNFPASMLGPARRPFFRGKARESRDLLPFCVGLVRPEDPRLPRRGDLAEAGEALLRVYDVLSRTSGRRLTPEAHKEALVGGLRFLAAWTRARGHRTIKHHYFVHMVERAGAAGNPRSYSTYRDEALNRQTKRVARSVGPGRAFARKVLAKTALLAGRADAGPGPSGGAA
jgi:hypothetical protein